MTFAGLQVFNGVSELVQSALDGYHVCLFSYGKSQGVQGGSGGDSKWWFRRDQNADLEGD